MLGERLNVVKTAAIFLSIFGGICIAQPHFLFGDIGSIEVSQEKFDCHVIGYVSASLGTFTGAMVLILIRMVGKDCHTIQLLFSFFVFGFLSSIVL